MKDTKSEAKSDGSEVDSVKVYELGYLIMSSVPSDKVADEVTAIKDILSKNGATIIGEEEPSLSTLAYEMTKKVGAQNQRFNEGYFGWVKFSMSKDGIEAAKNAIENLPHILRMLLITTIKENTYLGKRIKDRIIIGAQPSEASDLAAPAEAVAVASPVASVEEMDKSIDEMVKGA